ncbi:unnamed protein product [Phyllotreta striolata]|uniref:Uncharacterized protein n=1 Tax=Phyllotreta striolata TaxID=444603 RepID=A0A9N9TNY6_PHYSR|nr:unnamed protein product [Phyllotreta striolata]
MGVKLQLLLGFLLLGRTAAFATAPKENSTAPEPSEYTEKTRTVPPKPDANTNLIYPDYQPEKNRSRAAAAAAAAPKAIDLDKFAPNRQEAAKYRLTTPGSLFDFDEAEQALEADEYRRYRPSGRRPNATIAYSEKTEISRNRTSGDGAEYNELKVETTHNIDYHSLYEFTASYEDDDGETVSPRGFGTDGTTVGTAGTTGTTLGTTLGTTSEPSRTTLKPVMSNRIESDTIKAINELTTEVPTTRNIVPATTNVVSTIRNAVPTTTVPITTTEDADSTTTIESTTATDFSSTILSETTTNQPETTTTTTEVSAETTTEGEIATTTSEGDTSSTGIETDSTPLATREVPIQSDSYTDNDNITTLPYSTTETYTSTGSTADVTTKPVEIIDFTTVQPTESTTFPAVYRNLSDGTTGSSTNTTMSVSTSTESTESTDAGTLGGRDDNNNKIAAIVISTVGVVCLVLLAGLLYVMRKRQRRFNYKQRCRPVGLDDYSVDNVSGFNSTRRKLERQSKRSYGNPAFDDPVAVTHPLNFPALAKFAGNPDEVKAEFEEIPQISAKTHELPEGCEPKNRYANVIPLPETRVYLQPIEGYPNSDYINANYVTGPKNTKGYYIACQAPMSNTVDDFWRMVWEQQTKVILMLTHLFENGVEKCVDYLPPSEVLDCNRLFGDFQITLKKRDVKDKYIISNLQLKNMVSNSWREITHFWYLGWPERGVPPEESSIIAFLIEARSYMKSATLDKNASANGHPNKVEASPVVVHCSPGTGRTGVLMACDIAIREFEQTRLVDVPKIVYRIRRDRASAVQTKEQYMFIYKVVSLYATKLTGGALESF